MAQANTEVDHNHIPVYTPENESISPDEPTSDDDSVIDVNISPALLHMIKIPPEMYPDPSGKCVVSCSGRKSVCNLIRCSSYMMWVHLQCIGEKSDYTGPWVCHLCRTTSVRICHLFNVMTNMKKEFTQRLNTCKKNNTEISLPHNIITI